MIVESYEDVIKLSGTIRRNEWETLHTAISLSLKRHPEGVILDCGSITECTEEGAATFRSVMDFLNHQKSRVIVAAVPKAVKDVLKSVEDLRSQLPMTESVEDARRSLYFFTGGELEDEPHKKKKLVDGSRSNYHFLVVLAGTECDEYVLTTARELAEGLSANVHVMYPLIVPREMPLKSPMPEDEALARTVLAKAEEKFSRNGTHHELVLERGRDVASAIDAALVTHPSTHVILGVPSTDRAETMIHSILGHVTGSAVIFVRGPLDKKH